MYIYIYIYSIGESSDFVGPCEEEAFSTRCIYVYIWV